MGKFWQKLAQQTKSENRSFTVLAPMEDVTDVVFRQIVQSQGRPDVFFTEFTNVEGICSPKGRAHVIHRFEYLPEQKPIIAQVWGKTPESFDETVRLVVDLGFTGIDINMGCPVPNVIKNGAGGGMIQNPDLALEVIHAAKEAVEKYKPTDEFSFSIKTRIGFSYIDLSWIELLLKQNLDAITIHMRTVREQSKVPAHWELSSEIVKLRDSISPATVLIGNGDIDTKQKIKDIYEIHHFDGAMIGRGIFTDLWIFNKDAEDAAKTPTERLQVLKQHLTLFANQWTNKKNYELMKKFFKVYLKGFDGAKKLRDELNLMKKPEEMIARVEQELLAFQATVQ